MAHLSKSAATLRVMGDNLVPDEINSLLGCLPSTSYVKGEVIRGKKSGRDFTMRTGMWRLEATSCEPENLDSQVAEILSQLTQDLNVWTNLKDRFDIDLFCGFYMEVTNEGVEISSATLKLLGERGIALGLDIYGPVKENTSGS